MKNATQTRFRCVKKKISLIKKHIENIVIFRHIDESNKKRAKALKFKGLF